MGIQVGRRTSRKDYGHRLSMSRIRALLSLLLLLLLLFFVLVVVAVVIL